MTLSSLDKYIIIASRSGGAEAMTTEGGRNERAGRPTDVLTVLVERHMVLYRLRIVCISRVTRLRQSGGALLRKLGGLCAGKGRVLVIIASLKVASVSGTLQHIIAIIIILIS
jgi:hypothetical protein